MDQITTVGVDLAKDVQCRVWVMCSLRTSATDSRMPRATISCFSRIDAAPGNLSGFRYSFGMSETATLLLRMARISSECLRIDATAASTLGVGVVASTFERHASRFFGVGAPCNVGAAIWCRGAMLGTARRHASSASSAISFFAPESESQDSMRGHVAPSRAAAMPHASLTGDATLFSSHESPLGLPV